MTSKQRGEMNLIEDMIEAETTESNIALKLRTVFINMTVFLEILAPENKVTKNFLFV